MRRFSLWILLLLLLANTAAYAQTAPSSPGDYVNRGTAQYAKGDFDGAIADYDKAIALDRNYVVAYINRGNARDDKGDHDGAIADYDKAIALNPNEATAYYNRGIARRAKGDLDGAIADYD